MVNGLHHVTIRVQDPERARTFYEQTLGFSFIELPVDSAFVAEWRGSPTDGMLLATQLGNTFLILAPPLEGTPDDDRFSERRIGVDHLAFGVDDPAVLDEVVTALEEASDRHGRDRDRSGARQVVRRVPRSRQRAMGVLPGDLSGMQPATSGRCWTGWPTVPFML